MDIWTSGLVARHNRAAPPSYENHAEIRAEVGTPGCQQEPNQPSGDTFCCVGACCKTYPRPVQAGGPVLE